MKKIAVYIMIFFSCTISKKLIGQQLEDDTLFLLKNGDHTIFVDNSIKSKFYNEISDFKFEKFEKNSYATLYAIQIATA
jgi:hypothetical protein